MVLILISLMIGGAEPLSTGLEECLFKSFVSFTTGVSVFGVVELWFFTYSGHKPLLRGEICKGFLPCCVLPSHSEDCLPSLAGFYNFDVVPFVCFVFVACTHSVRNALSI